MKKKLLSIILAASFALGLGWSCAAAEQTKPVYIIDHNYADFVNVKDIFATGKYYVGGMSDGKDASVAEDANVSFRLENGYLTATAKSTVESGFDIDLRENKQPLTGKVNVEYKIKYMAGKTVRAETKSAGLTALSLGFDTQGPWAATGKQDPQTAAVTEWGPYLTAASDKTYVIKAVFNIDTRTIEALTYNGKNMIPNGANYFRQNMSDLDRIRIYPDKGGVAGEDMYGLEYIKVWQDRCVPTVTSQVKAGNTDPEGNQSVYVINTIDPNGEYTIGQGTAYGTEFSAEGKTPMQAESTFQNEITLSGEAQFRFATVLTGIPKDRDVDMMKAKAYVGNDIEAQTSFSLSAVLK